MWGLLQVVTRNIQLQHPGIDIGLGAAPFRLDRFILYLQQQLLPFALQIQ